MTLLQVSGGPPGTRELSSDGVSALWPHLHGLPRPATDEAAHGPVAEEVQVSPFFNPGVPPWLFFYPHRTVVLWIPFESPVAFRMKYSTIGLLAGFSHRPVNLLCISKILPMVGGGVQSALFSTVINQVFSYTCQPRVIDLAHTHLCTIIKSVCVYKWWKILIQHPLILFLLFFFSFSCCCFFFTSLGPGVMGINPDRQQRKQIWHSGNSWHIHKEKGEE